MWWHTHLFAALRRQRQEDLCEFKGNLVYKANFRTDRSGTQKNPVLESPPHTHTQILRAMGMKITRVYRTFGSLVVFHALCISFYKSRF